MKTKLLILPVLLIAACSPKPDNGLMSCTDLQISADAISSRLANMTSSGKGAAMQSEQLLRGEMASVQSASDMQGCNIVFTAN